MLDELFDDWIKNIYSLFDKTLKEVAMPVERSSIDIVCNIQHIGISAYREKEGVVIVFTDIVNQTPHFLKTIRRRCRTGIVS